MYGCCFPMPPDGRRTRSPIEPLYEACPPGHILTTRAFRAKLHSRVREHQDDNP